MDDVLLLRIKRAMNLTLDFYNFIPEESLSLNIQGKPSNTIGEQAWCIIGARESYLKALKMGQWDGFSCSLIDCKDKSLVLSKLEVSSRNIVEFLQGANIGSLNQELLFDLLEHEIQHHGQLIRYSYANKLGFPKSWNNRYTV